MKKKRPSPAKRASVKQAPAKKVGAKKVPAKPATVKRRSSATSASAPPRHEPTQGLYGWITHTDIGSMNPAATREWCIRALGWTFRPSFAMPGGEYHLFAFSEKGGGGIHPITPPETPSSIPYVHVADAQAAFDKALREGAEAVSPPMRVMEGVTIALVRAPGGVLIGLSGP